MNTFIYIVTEFGSSGDDEIYPPDVKLFYDSDEAYKYYNKIKQQIIDQDYPYDIAEYDTSESIYQITYEDSRAKRPCGVLIKKILYEK